jgi:hypothetical protein
MPGSVTTGPSVIFVNDVCAGVSVSPVKNESATVTVEVFIFSVARIVSSPRQRFLLHDGLAVASI